MVSLVHGVRVATLSASHFDAFRAPHKSGYPLSILSSLKVLSFEELSIPSQAGELKASGRDEIN
ncbi:MAG: hypothetical protein PVG70_13295 [Desulfobacterales bacterium]|jgi:hypothetical protein